MKQLDCYKFAYLISEAAPKMDWRMPRQPWTEISIGFRPINGSKERMLSQFRMDMVMETLYRKIHF